MCDSFGSDIGWHGVVSGPYFMELGGAAKHTHVNKLARHHRPATGRCTPSPFPPLPLLLPRLHPLSLSFPFPFHSHFSFPSPSLSPFPPSSPFPLFPISRPLLQSVPAYLPFSLPSNASAVTRYPPVIRGNANQRNPIRTMMAVMILAEMRLAVAGAERTTPRR